MHISPDESDCPLDDGCTLPECFLDKSGHGVPRGFPVFLCHFRPVNPGPHRP